MLRRGTLLSATLVPLLVILLVTLLLVTALSGRTMRRFFLEDTSRRLEALAAVSAPALAAAAGDEPALQALCREMGRNGRARLTVIGADGRVLSDSLERPGQMDNHADRPEVAAALAGTTGRATRYSATREERLMYVAVPAPATEASRGLVVRAAVSIADLDGELGLVYRQIVLAGLGVALLAAAFGYFRARALGRAIGRLQAGAEACASGRLDGRLAASETVEIAAVAEAMNRMAVQLGERIEAVERQRGELEAVLSSMVEGVLAVDGSETVIGLNAAGARVLGITPERAVGRSIQEVGRHPDLTELAQQVLAGAAPLERDVALGGSGDTRVQVRASGLRDAGGARLGALLVLNDVTRLRRLETMRRDFVANVSHELKTPITSIKGFVETIIDEPPADEADLRRFLEIVRRQADRLDSIITDLLALSRLEQDSDGRGIELIDSPLAPVLERVVRDLAARRPDQAERVALDCPGGARAAINAPLLEQAVTNLLENALKYSPPGTRVTVGCAAGPGQVRIEVRDEGPGIAAEHLPRLFERFYRVDKARSRQLGGTGLGLAIVKHIAQAHGGRAEVASEVGRGSTFTITLPASEGP